MRFGSLGAPELILIVVAIMLVFGTSKLGDLGGAVGKSVRDFKKATQDDDAAKAAKASKTVVTTTEEPAIVNGQPVERTVTTAEKTTAVGVGDYRPSDSKPL